jgi:phosphoglycerate dehydrogenase-like enzyme
MRNAAIDLAAASAHGVTVCGTASRSEPPVELTWALILGLCRHLVPETAAFRSGGPWQSTIGTDLAGATLGLLGLGKIGSRVATIGRAFGMNVLAWSQNLTADRCDAVGAALAPSLPDLLAGSDIVSIHLALSPRTRGLVDAAALAAMKPSALLVNTSRAAIVDTAALIAALDSGRLAGAGLDVFDREPLPGDHPLRTLPNVLATPHLGYVTAGNYRRYFTEAVEDIAAFEAGAPIRVLG